MARLSEVFRFEGFVLDPSERKLTRDGVEIALAPKVFDLLEALVRDAGHLLRKEDLLRRLWPDVVVLESNLSQSIFVLRRALGESAERRFIETVPKAGYRFVVPVERLGPRVSPPLGAAQEPPRPRLPMGWLLLAAVLAVAVGTLVVVRHFASQAPEPAPGEPAAGRAFASYESARESIERGDAPAALRQLESLAPSADEPVLLRAARINVRLLLGDEIGARRLAAEAPPAAETLAALREADRLWVQATWARASGDAASALVPLERLFALEPAAVHVGTRLAAVLQRAGRGREAELVVARLRQLPAEIAEDPQIDLIEAQLAYMSGDSQRALFRARSAAETVARRGGPGLIGCRARQLEGAILLDLGDLEAAATTLATGLEQAEALGLEGEQGRAWYALGLVDDRRGRLESAAKSYARGLAALERTGDLVGAAIARLDLAGTDLSSGRVAAADAHYSAALDTDVIRSSLQRRAPALTNSGFARLELGDLAGARERFEECLALGASLPYPGTLVYVSLGLAEIEIESGDITAAALHLERAERVAMAQGSKELLGLLEGGRANWALAAGDRAGAEAALARARPIAEEVGAGELLLQVAVTSATLAARDGRCESAEASVVGAESALAEGAYPFRRAIGWAEVARCRARAGEAEQVSLALARAGALLTHCDCLRSALVVDLVRCEVLRSAGNVDESARCAEKVAGRSRAAGLQRIARAADSLVSPGRDAPRSDQ